MRGKVYRLSLDVIEIQDDLSDKVVDGFTHESGDWKWVLRSFLAKLKLFKPDD